MKHVLLFLLCLAQPLLALAQIDISRIEIVLPVANATSLDLATSIQRALQKNSPNLEISLQGKDNAPNSRSPSTLIIAIGDASLPWLSDKKNDYAGAIVFLANAAVFREEEQQNKKITALFRDQPLSRQLQLTKLLIPNLRRVAIIRSERELAQSKAKLQQNTDLAITETVIDTQSEWAKQLSQLMQSNDVLLGIDDSKIYNGDTIRSILLTSYRHGKGLIGPSRAFVSAGSLASCYTTADQYLQQLVEMVAVTLREQRLPPAQFPARFHVAINKQVASSLNLSIPDENTLSARLHNLQGECGDGC